MIALASWIAIGVIGAMLFTVTAIQVSPVVAAVVLAGIPVAMVLQRFPEVMLVLTVTAIPLEGLGRFTSGSSAVIVSVAKLFGLLAMTGWGIRLLRERQWPTFPREFIALAGFWLIGLYTLTHTSDMPHGIQRASSFFATFVFFLLIVNLVRTERMVHAMFIGLLISTFFLGLFSIAQRFLPGFTIFPAAGLPEGVGVYRDQSELETLGVAIDRSGGATGSPHVYAANLLVAIPIYLHYMTFCTHWLLRVGAAGGAFIAVINLLLTHTRSGLLVLGFGLVLMLWKGVVRVSPRTLVAGIILAALAILFLPETVYNRLFDSGVYTVQGSGTLATRLDYWTAAIQMLEHNWLFGMGIGNFSDLHYYVPSADRNDAFIHNIYLQLFNEVGIFGFSCILAFLIFVFLRLVRAERQFKRVGRNDLGNLCAALWIAFLGVLVIGMTMDVLHFAVKDWWTVTALAVCLYWISNRPDLNVRNGYPPIQFKTTTAMPTGRSRPLRIEKE